MYSIVTVRYEHRDYLAQGRAEKISKYSPMLGSLRRNLHGTAAEVIPIVVGSRGALPAFTTKALNRLGIGKRDWLTISMIALKRSIEMVYALMDQTKRVF